MLLSYLCICGYQWVEKSIEFFSTSSHTILWLSLHNVHAIIRFLTIRLDLNSNLTCHFQPGTEPSTSIKDMIATKLCNLLKFDNYHPVFNLAGTTSQMAYGCIEDRHYHIQRRQVMCLAFARRIRPNRCASCRREPACDEICMITLASGISIELSPTCARTQQCVCSFSAPKLVKQCVPAYT